MRQADTAEHRAPPKGALAIRAPLPPRTPVPLGSNALDASSVHADPCAGWIIGRCEIIRRLSPGSVKRLLAQREKSLVVLKKIDGDLSMADDLAEHAAALMKLEHPSLARSYECETCEEGVFWVMEFMSGATLSECRAACRKAGKSLPVGVVFASIHEAALGLSELHAHGFGHGDVSDGNLLVSFAGTAKLLNAGVLDCVQHLPPDARCDVFKLAHLLYECLTGQPLAAGDFAPPSGFNHALEPQIDALLRQALGPDRTKRFANGADFASALKQAAGAFMWKRAQRAEFVGGLFRRRQQREQVLISTAAERIAVRQSGKFAAPVLAEPELPIIVGALIDPPALVETTVLASKPVNSNRRAAALIGAGACAALLVCAGVAALWPSAPAFVPPPIVVQLAVATPEVPEAPAAEAPPAPEAEPAPTVAEAAPPPVARPSRPKRHTDAAPLPPWLARGGHH